MTTKSTNMHPRAVAHGNKNHTVSEIPDWKKLQAIKNNVCYRPYLKVAANLKEALDNFEEVMAKLQRCDDLSKCYEHMEELFHIRDYCNASYSILIDCPLKENMPKVETKYNGCRTILYDVADITKSYLEKFHGPKSQMFGLTHTITLDDDMKECFNSFKEAISNNIERTSNTVKSASDNFMVFKDIILFTLFGCSLYNCTVAADTTKVGFWGSMLAVTGLMMCWTYGEKISEIVSPYLKYATTEPQAQAFSFDTEQIISFFVKAFSVVILGDMYNTVKKNGFNSANIFNEIKKSSMSIKSISDVCKISIDILIKVVNLISKYLFGGEFLNEESEICSELQKWCDEVDDLHNKLQKGDYDFDVKAFKYLILLEDRITMLLVDSKTSIYSDVVYKVINVHRNRLTSMRSLFTAINLRPTSTRVCPLMIGLFGPPGIGKTYITEMLLNDIYRDAFEDDEKVHYGDDVSKLTWVKPFNSKYADGYKGHPFAVMDDAFNTKDSVQAPSTDATDIIRWVNTVPTLMVSAELQLKAINQCKMRAIVLQTNKQVLDDMPSITDIGAVKRRIHLPVLVSVLPEFSENPKVKNLWKVKPNFESFPKDDNGYPIPMKEHYQFHLLDLYKTQQNRNYYVKKTLNYDQLLKLAIEYMDKFRAEHENKLFYIKNSRTQNPRQKKINGVSFNYFFDTYMNPLLQEVGKDPDSQEQCLQMMYEEWYQSMLQVRTIENCGSKFALTQNRYFSYQALGETVTLPLGMCLSYLNHYCELMEIESPFWNTEIFEPIEPSEDKNDVLPISKSYLETLTLECPLYWVESDGKTCSYKVYDLNKWKAYLFPAASQSFFSDALSRVFMRSTTHLSGVDSPRWNLGDTSVYLPQVQGFYESVDDSAHSSLADFVSIILSNDSQRSADYLEEVLLAGKRLFPGSTNCVFAFLHALKAEENADRDDLFEFDTPDHLHKSLVRFNEGVDSRSYTGRLLSSCANAFGIDMETVLVAKSHVVGLFKNFLLGFVVGAGSYLTFALTLYSLSTILRMVCSLFGFIFAKLYSPNAQASKKGDENSLYFDQTGEAIGRILMDHSTFEVLNDENRRICYIVFYKGRRFVTNAHSIEVLYNQYLANKDGVVTIRNCRSREVKIDIPLSTFENHLKLEDRDLGFAEVDPSFIAAKRDISHFFVSKSTKLPEKFLGRWSVPNGNVGSDYEREVRKLSHAIAENSVPTAFLEDGTYRYYDDINKKHIRSAKGYFYKNSHNAGDCGAMLYLMESSQRNQRIFGIHAAGMTRAVDSYATAIFSEDLEVADKFFGNTVVLQVSNEPKTQSAFFENFEVLSKYPNKSNQVTQTAYIKTPFYDLCGPVDLQPSELDRPLVDNVKRYAKHKPIIEQKLLRACTMQYYTEMLSVHSERGPVTYVKRTFGESIWGIHGSKHFNKIAMSTSAGAPHLWEVKMPDGKKAFLGKPESCGPRTMETIVELYDYIYEHECYDEKKLLNKFNLTTEKNQLNSINMGFLKNIHFVIDPIKEFIKASAAYELKEVLFIDYFKDELLKSGKDPRIFSCSPLWFTIVTRMYVGHFCEEVMANNVRNGIAVGINPYSEEWHYLAQRLTVFSNIGDTDFKQYDTTISAQLNCAHIEPMNDLVYKYTGVDALVLANIYYSIAYSMHVTNDFCIVMWNGSLPSGCPLTAMLNSINQQIIFRVVWCLILGGIKYVYTFSQHVVLVTFGDDGVRSVSNEAKLFFSPAAISEKMKLIGFDITAGNKLGVGVYGDLSAISFLKRDFKFHKYLGRYVAPLKPKSMMKMLYWYKNKPFKDEVMLSNLNKVILECAFHDRDFFLLMKDKIFSKCAEIGFTLPDNWSYEDAALFNSRRVPDFVDTTGVCEVFEPTY